MIVYHDVIGSKETSFHTFEIETSSLDIVISAGEYNQAGSQRFLSETGAAVSIPSPSAQTYYEVWLADSGLVVIYEDDVTEYAEVPNPIDRLAWFTVPANATSLDKVEIHVMRTVEG
jgi:hypothetical protein